MSVKTLFPLSALALAIISSSALAQTPENNDEQAVEVITVKGDFTEQNLQRTANSVSVLTSNDVLLRNAQNLEELVALAPNVNFSQGSQRARYYQIRGIGERSQFQTPINPSVGVMIDDIDFSGIGGVASMFDVAQTEIYRGPQGTRFGANAMAGLINIRTTEPTDDTEAKLKLTAGNYASYGVAGAYSAKANDSVNYRIVAEKYVSDGFIHNSYLNKDNTNNRDELTLRAKATVKASEQLTVKLAAYFIDFDNGYDAFSLDNTRETWSDTPGTDAQRTRAFSINSQYTGLDIADITAIASFSDTDLSYGYDEDWSYQGFHPWEYASKDRYLRDRAINTFELRLTSRPAQAIFNDTTDWVAGVFYKQDDTDLTRQYTYLSADFSSSFDTTTTAVYGQLTSRLADNLQLVSGVRYEQRNADYQNNEPFTANPDDTMLGGKLVLSYQLDNSLVYGQISRGFKAGGANVTGTIPSEYRTFKPEFNTNYELGFKQSLMDNRAFVRTALFYMNRQDMQVSTSLSHIRTDGSVEFVPYLGNSASGWNKGIELESGIELTENLSLTGSLAWLKTRYQAFIGADGELRPEREQAHAPSFQYYVAATYNFANNWQLQLASHGMDKFYFSDSHDQQSSFYNLVDFSASYSIDNWRFALTARNLFNKDYATRGFYFGNDPRDGYTDKTYTQLGEPRVVMLTADYQF